MTRLTPIEDIKWMHHGERAAMRNSIALFTRLKTRIQNGEELSPDDIAFLSNYTASNNGETWLQAALETYARLHINYRAALSDMAQHDLTAYHEFINPDEVPAKHHIWLCERLMKIEAGELGLLVVSASPGSGKSSYGSKSFSQWFMGRHPDKKVLAVSHGQTFVENAFSKPNRDVIASDDYRLVFPDVDLKSNEKSATEWRTNQNGVYSCRGAGAGIAGVRANLLNIDDPIKNSKDAESAAARDNLFKWIGGDLLPRRLPGAPIVLIATKYHSDDPIGRLEQLHADDPSALPGPVEFVNLPAQADVDDPVGRREGEWLWEEFYGAGHYVTLRATMSASQWSSLYMGVPLDAMGSFVSEDSFQRYDHYPKKPGNFKKTIISVDTAQKGTERSAYTAVLIFREGTDGHHYLIHGTRVKDKLEDVMTLLKRLAKEHNADSIIIEDAGQGSQIIENYSRDFVCPIVPFNPRGKGSKEFMFDAATPWITSGDVLFPKQAPWLNDILAEMIAFPDGKYKDYVDAFAQYVEHSKKKRVKLGTKRLSFA